MTYSNPREKVIIDDWPIGSGARGAAIFNIEKNARGERCTRTTEKRNGTWGKPKLGTYSPRVRIVDGDDGKTYVISWTGQFFDVMQGNMKFCQESIFPRDEQFETVRAMMDIPAEAVRLAEHRT